MAEDEIYQANLPELGSVPLDYFSGNRHITDGRLPCLLNAVVGNTNVSISDVQDAQRTYHEPTITPDTNSNSPGQQPDLDLIGSTLVAQFTVNTDTAYRLFKIPSHFTGDAAFHVHWTKEAGAGGNSDQSGNAVKWEISYTVFAGGSGHDINVSPTVLELEDTYDDSGTTTRIMHRTADVLAPGFVAGYYVGVCIQAITPTGSALTCEPALASMDMTFTENINK